MKKTALILALAFTPAAASEPWFQPVATLTGVAEAHDGDDLKFGSVQVRLIGVAAPEYNRSNRDPGGREAYEALAARVDGRVVTCYLDGSTAGRYRPAALCFLRDQDLGAAQVRAGVARDCPRYSGGRYRSAEAAARAEGHDLSRDYQLPEYCE
jgi:endonuclease YncB( thermonuclease family)